MLLMVVEVENVLVEFHYTPTTLEVACLRSNFGDEFNASDWQDAPVGFS
jgi:hypothetical protein